MRPTSADLRGLWLHAYSRSLLVQAEQWVADMETRNSQSQFRALICAAVVAHARPFTTSQVTKSERVVASNGMETVATRLEGQAAQIRKVSAQLDVSKTAPQNRSQQSAKQPGC